jgi:hypothetical protein
MRILRRTAPARVGTAITACQQHLEKHAAAHHVDPGGCPDRRQGETVAGSSCQLPAADSGPDDIVRFHQRLPVRDLATLQQATLACAQVNRANLIFGLLQQYEQTWEYRETSRGQTVAYLSLAPLERRRVQVAYKRKTNISRTDRSKRTSRYSYDSSSSTKASTSTTNSSVSRNKWSVSASASYGIGGAGWGVEAQGSLEGSTEQTRQRAVEGVTEETQKSSSEILSETETTTTIGLQTSFEQIEERQLVNPYADRSLLISLAQLISTYCVTTKTAGIIPCIIIDFDPVSAAQRRVGPSVKFDENFVSAHRHFLRMSLIDQSLVDYFDSRDATDSQPVDTGEISSNAIRCLQFMYDDPAVFAPVGTPNFGIDESFDMTPMLNSGFSDAVANDLTDYYLLMASIRHLWRRDAADFTAGRIDAVEHARRAVEYVIVLNSGLAGWPSTAPDDKRKLQDASQRTEQFRRIPGFLELAEKLVIEPLGTRAGEGSPADASSGQSSDNQGSSQSTTGQTQDVAGQTVGGNTVRPDNPRLSPQARIVNHLNCFGRFYTEEFLHFLHEWTGITAIVELVAGLDDEYRSLLSYLDFEQSFVDGTSWVVPFEAGLDAQTAASAFLDEPVDLSKLSDLAVAQAVRMPAEGLHIEVAPGECTLPGVPVDSRDWTPAMPLRVTNEPIDGAATGDE